MARTTAGASLAGSQVLQALGHRNAVCEPALAPPSRNLGQVIADHKDRLAQLSEAIYTLESRLIPVLKPANPNSGGVGKDEQDAVRAVDTIIGLTDYVNYMSSRVSSLLERLDV